MDGTFEVLVVLDMYIQYVIPTVMVNNHVILITLLPADNVTQVALA